MGSERIKVERKIKDCGTSWCEQCQDGGKPHTIKYTYNSIVDTGTVEIDGEVVMCEGDDLIRELARMIVEATSEEESL